MPVVRISSTIIFLILCIAGFDGCWPDAKPKIPKNSCEVHPSLFNVDHINAVKINVGGGVCSGAFLTPRHIVTAAHCFLINENKAPKGKKDRFLGKSYASPEILKHF